MDVFQWISTQSFYLSKSTNITVSILDFEIVNIDVVFYGVSYFNTT